jgi:hypothetical protein
MKKQRIAVSVTKVEHAGQVQQITLMMVIVR